MYRVSFFPQLFVPFFLLILFSEISYCNVKEISQRKVKNYVFTTFHNILFVLSSSVLSTEGKGAIVSLPKRSLRFLCVSF